jgi:hypothetical protein
VSCFMVKLNNPAARLHALLSKAKQGGEQYRAKSAIESWTIILNGSADNQALMLKRLGRVMELPSAIKTRIESIPDVEHGLYLRWLPKVEEAFRANHLTGPFHLFIDKIDEVTLLGLEHCASALSRRDPDAEISEDELQALKKQVDALIKETAEGDMEEDLKRFILKHLLAIRSAIDEYTLFGSKPLVTAFGETIATVYTEQQAAVKASTSPHGVKFWKCVAGLSVLLTVGDHGLKLAEGVFKLLEPPLVNAAASAIQDE